MVYQFNLRLAERLKLGGPSLGRSPDAHKQRRLDNQNQIDIFEEIKGRHNFWSRAKRPALFFRAPLSVQSQTAMMPSSNPIERSFELAAERCDDLTPLVYRRLFELHPETQKMFRTEGSEPVRGSMLALTIDAILDFAGERTGHFRMIAAEISSHDAYGTSRELFIAFFGIIAQTLRDVVGADWSDDIDAAWQKLIGDIESFVAAQ
jgi:hemoglobin-like flavoprotein